MNFEKSNLIFIESSSFATSTPTTGDRKAGTNTGSHWAPDKIVIGKEDGSTGAIVSIEEKEERVDDHKDERVHHILAYGRENSQGTGQPEADDNADEAYWMRRFGKLDSVRDDGPSYKTD